MSKPVATTCAVCGKELKTIRWEWPTFTACSSDCLEAKIKADAKAEAP